MTSTLILRDLSVSKELDGKAMSAVRGGFDDQANGIAQQNLQSMAAAANVGNGLYVAGGPLTIQSDNSFHQDASNDSFAKNVDAFSIKFPGIKAVR